VVEYWEGSGLMNNCEFCGRFTKWLGVRTFGFDIGEFHDWTIRIGLYYCKHCDHFSAYTLNDEKHDRFLKWLKRLMGTSDERDKKMNALHAQLHDVMSRLGKQNDHIRKLERALIDKAVNPPTPRTNPHHPE
jgi:hypothetical protein